MKLRHYILQSNVASQKLVCTNIYYFTIRVRSYKVDHQIVKHCKQKTVSEHITGKGSTCNLVD